MSDTENDKTSKMPNKKAIQKESLKRSIKEKQKAIKENLTVRK